MNKKLLAIKKDFLKFMIQINPSMEINQTLILHTLLLETGKYDVDNKESSTMINQEDIVNLTGLNKSIVSNILNNLITFHKHFEVFEKRIKKKKYYNCLLTYKEYMQLLLENSLKSAIINIKFIPGLLSRLEKLQAKSINVEEEIAYTKEYLYYYLLSSNIYKLFTQNYSLKIDKFIVDKKLQIKTIDQIINSIKFADSSELNNDSLLNIRREFIKNILEVSTSIGGKPEILHLFLTLFITKNPITQNEIKKITQLSKGSISESLNLMLQMNLIKIIKKPKDRKKYYNKSMNLSEFGLYKLIFQQQRNEQLFIAITNKFIPQIKQLDIVEPKERDRLLGELYELQSAFSMFTEYMEQFFKEYKIIKKEVLKRLNISLELI